MIQTSFLYIKVLLILFYKLIKEYTTFTVITKFGHIPGVVQYTQEFVSLISPALIIPLSHLPTGNHQFAFCICESDVFCYIHRFILFFRFHI